MVSFAQVLLLPYVIDRSSVHVQRLRVILDCSHLWACLPLSSANWCLLLLQYQLSTIWVEVNWLLDSQIRSNVVIGGSISSLRDPRTTLRRLLASISLALRVISSSFEHWLQLRRLLLNWLRRCDKELLWTEILNKEAWSPWFRCLWLCLYRNVICCVSQLYAIGRFDKMIHLEIIGLESIQRYSFLVVLNARSLGLWHWLLSLPPKSLIFRRVLLSEIQTYIVLGNMRNSTI